MQPCQKSIITSGKARMEDAQTQKVKLQFIAKAHLSILQNPMAKKYMHIQGTDQNTTKTNYRKDFMSSKEITIEQFLQILVPADMTTTKRNTFQQKNSKIEPFVVKLVLEPICKRFSKSARR